MTHTHIHLIRQAGESRVTFGISPDAQTACTKLQETVPGQLELVGVVQCRNLRAGTRVVKLLQDHYQTYQEGEWYVLPSEELRDLNYWFQVLAKAVGTAKSLFYEMPGSTKKKYPRSKLMAAVAWLEAHDPDCALPVRTVAARAGVSSGTAHNAARYLLALQEAE